MQRYRQSPNVYTIWNGNLIWNLVVTLSCEGKGLARTGTQQRAATSDGVWSTSSDCCFASLYSYRHLVLKLSLLSAPFRKRRVF
jgi:hypothetical protein